MQERASSSDSPSVCCWTMGWVRGLVRCNITWNTGEEWQVGGHVAKMETEALGIAVCFSLPEYLCLRSIQDKEASVALAVITRETASGEHTTAWLHECVRMSLSEAEEWVWFAAGICRGSSRFSCPPEE